MDPYNSVDEVSDAEFGSIHWHNAFGEQFVSSNKVLKFSLIQQHIIKIKFIHKEAYHSIVFI